MGMFSIPPVVFFAVASFLMDFLFSNGLLTDAFFADAIFDAEQWRQGALGALSALGYAAGCLIFGPLSERTGRRALTMLSAALVATCFLALPFSRNFHTLVVLAMTKRFLISMYWPALMAWMADASLRKNFARNLLAFNLSWTIGSMLGNWLAGHLGQSVNPGPHGYNPLAPYLVSAFAAAALLVWLGVCDPRPRGDDAPPIRVLESPQSHLFLTKGWVAQFAVFSAVSSSLFMLPRLAELPENSLAEATQSTIHSLRVGACLVVFLVMLRTSHWHFRFYPIYGSMAAGAVGLALIGLGAGFPVILTGSILLGVAMGVVYTVSLYYSLGITHTKGRGSAMHEALLGLGNAVGPALGGAAGWAFATPRAPFLAGLAPLVLGAAAVAVLRRWIRNGQRELAGAAAER